MAAGAALPEPWPDTARDALVGLLAAGPGAVTVFEELDQAGLLSRHAARLADSGKPFAVEAAQAKLAASEAAMFTTWAACQTLAGRGYLRDSPVQKWFREAKLDEIWDGTSDIMRVIISRGLFS